MSVPAYLRNFARRIFHREQVADEMEAELRAHIELRADDLERSGLSRAEAERRARIEFGGRERYKEEIHEAMGGSFFDTMFKDVRYSLRLLRKSPGFTVTAVLTLALAIGANAVVFAVLNALVLRPLNVPAAENIHVVGHAHSIWGYESYPNYLDLRDRNRSFDALAADNISQAGLDTGKNPSEAWLFEATGNYFDVLGLEPYLGRFFHTADEHGPNSAPYIVLSYAYWRDHFQGDRGVVGRTVLLNKHPFTIIGVAPAGFVGTFIAFSADLFVPIVNRGQVDGDDQLNQRGSRWISEVIGRLKPGVSQAQAAADLDSIGAYLGRSYPNDEEQTLLTFKLQRPGPGSAFGGAVTAFLAGLMLMAGLILLAACANLGSLFAARAADRSREVALRLALGARRVRILRQLLTEAMVLSLVGGAVGLWGSVVLLRAISAWRPFPQFPLNLPLNPDAKVYALALLLAVASGFLFGIVPVHQVLRTDPYQVMKSLAGSTSVARRGKLKLRDVLLVMQIAVCAVLVTSSIVAVRGLARSMHTKLGIDPRDAILVETDPRMAGYTGSQVPALQRRMMDALKSLPGVAQVALVSSPPLHMGWEDINIYSDETTDLKPSNAAADAVSFSISSEYFQAAGTALLKGRELTWHDDEGAPHVAVINQEFARRQFGSIDRAIGGHFRTRLGGRIQVVGVVEDGKYTANLAEDPQNAIFVPILQNPRGDAWLLVRFSSGALQPGAAVRSKLRDLDSGLPCFVQTWSEEMSGAFFASRMATLSLGVLGLMGAMLSLTGIFGMAAYSVSRRLRELGIRMALGARRKEVLQAALGRTFRLLAIGSAAGLGAGILATRILAFIVYQATPRDPVVLAGVVAAMALIGLVATWIPAQRALAIDPLVLLREE
jgi:predicted permease